MKSDLRSLGIGDGCWCDRAMDRKQWWKLCLQCMYDQQDYLQTAQVRTLLCAVCKDYFRRECDRAHHKCVGDRQRSVEEQPGAVQCTLVPECWLYTSAG